MKKLTAARGITLVELMTIVVIIGIVAAMAMPKFEASINKIKFRGSARDMVSKMRLARSNAVSYKQQYGVNFDMDAKTMTLFLDKVNPIACQFESGDSVCSVDSLPNEMTYVYPDFGGTSIVYKPNGSASATGNIYFIAYNANDGMVQTGTIEILASTGRTKVSEINSY